MAFGPNQQPSLMLIVPHLISESLSFPVTLAQLRCSRTPEWVRGPSNYSSEFSHPSRWAEWNSIMHLLLSYECEKLFICLSITCNMHSPVHCASSHQTRRRRRRRKRNYHKIYIPNWTILFVYLNSSTISILFTTLSVYELVMIVTKIIFLFCRC